MNVIADCVLTKGADLQDVVYMLQEAMLRQICWLNIEMHHELYNGRCPNPYPEYAKLCQRLEDEYNDASYCIHRDKDKDDA